MIVMAHRSTSVRPGRFPLDALVDRLRDPGFVARYRRQLSFRATGSHVSPVMLAACEADSRYAREWRPHAEECPSCRKLFQYFGLLD